MNNEPVAWMRQNEDGEWIETLPEKGIPLYTHPVKELTDDEIVSLFEPKYDVEIDDEMIVDFARAILRKAQKK